jgi:stress-induced-phosphoprotein 1
MLYFGVDTAQGLTLMSNGFMRDDRIFYFNQSNWVEMYNQQGESCSGIGCWDCIDRGTIYLEVTARKAWDSEGLEAIKELAQKRLKENGWDDVRPALAVTVRCATTHSIFQDLLIIHCSAWMITGVLEGDGLREQPQAGVEYYRRALDLVEWGRTIWKDVPKASRGAIFEHSFLIGVRSLYLKMFMNVGREFSIFLGRGLNCGRLTPTTLAQTLSSWNN